MLRLVVNDVRLNAVWLLWVFLLLNVGIAFAMGSFPHHYSGMRAGVALAMLMPLIVLLREEYYRGRNVLRSVPVRQDYVVYARYVSVILLGIAPVLYGWSYQELIELLGPHRSLTYLAQQFEPGYGVEHSLIARSIGWSVLVAFGMPFIVQFGSFWRILLAFLALQVVWGKIIDHLLNLSLQISGFLGMSRWIFFVSVFVIAIIAISARLSVWLEGQRES
jgi:hypothetical protein